MTPNNEKNIVIIGTGLAGYVLAKEFRKYDLAAKLTLITKSDGYFYSKPLLSTALTHQKTPDALCIHDAATMREQLHADIIVRSTVERIDANEKKVFFKDKKSLQHVLSYDQLVLANGAKPVEIPLSGNALHEIIHVNQIEDYRLFREKITNKKTIAILGAGLVGCEFANDLVQSGYLVVMMAPDDYLLSTLVPKPVGVALENAFVNAGIIFHSRVFAERIDKTDDVFEITLSNHKRIQADVVLSATGIKPDLSLATSASLKTHKGIITDAELRTSDSAIFALGDCAEVNGSLKLYVAPLLHQARILAGVLSDKKSEVSAPVMPIIIKTSLCPVVTMPAPMNTACEWSVTSQENGVRALCYDAEKTLCGFALSGDCVKEKNEWIKKL